MNVFRDTLRRIAERVADTRAVAIVGLDGIPVETYSVGEDVSIESVAAELLALVKAAQNPHAQLSFGAIRELALVGDGQRAVLSRISAEYYLLLLLGGEGALGHGRFELARAATGLQRGAGVRDVVIQGNQGPDRSRGGEGTLGPGGRADGVPHPHRRGGSRRFRQQGGIRGGVSAAGGPASRRRPAPLPRRGPPRRSRRACTSSPRPSSAPFTALPRRKRIPLPKWDRRSPRGRSSASSSP